MENPDRSFRQTQKQVLKKLHKKCRSQVLTCLQSRSQVWGRKVHPKDQVALFGPISATCRFGCLGSRCQKNFVVSAATDVCHLRNRARNTRKLKILMFEGFRGEKHHKNRKKHKREEKPQALKQLDMQEYIKRQRWQNKAHVESPIVSMNLLS